MQERVVPARGLSLRRRLISGTVGEGAVIVFRDITEEKAERLRVKRELDALTWVGRIREALDEDRLVLYSQPIVPLTGGRPERGASAPDGGPGRRGHRPGRFPGRGGEVRPHHRDRPVGGEARRVRLAAKGRHVGVNLSAESIVSPDMLAMIDHEIDDAGADPSNLVFEITETSLMRDIGKGEDFARGVVDLGCDVALDDFGTGFGTFTHVKKLPIKYLKIDIEFVRDLWAAPPTSTWSRPSSTWPRASAVKRSPRAWRTKRPCPCCAGWVWTTPRVTISGAPPRLWPEPERYPC